jgi:hypothetical protein
MHGKFVKINGNPLDKTEIKGYNVGNNGFAALPHGGRRHRDIQKGALQ